MTLKMKLKVSANESWERDFSIHKPLIINHLQITHNDVLAKEQRKRSTAANAAL
jgi:hypothetical protein